MLVQVIDLAIHVTEILRLDALYVGKHVLVSGYFSGEQKRAPTLVVHILGTAGTELQPGGTHRSFLRVVHHHMPGSAIRHPVRKSSNDIDPVVALCLAKTHVVFESGSGTQRAFLVVVIPAEAISSHGIPGIADDEEGCAIRRFECVTIRRGT